MQSKASKNSMPLYLSLILIAGMALGYMLSSSVGNNNFFSKSNNNTLQEISTLIKSKYVDEIGMDSINTYAIDEMLSHLDPHSIYISPAELESVNSQLEGHFTGIGVLYNIIDDTVYIVQLINNGPAKKAGIEVGDKILNINDSISLNKQNISEEFIRSKMRGEEGSKVSINVLRDGVTKKINITRATIAIPSVDAAYMLDAKTGYIKINKFAERTYEEFMQELEKLQKAKMENLVLDLRGNGGGFMRAATAIADEFLGGDKLIVYTQGNKTEKDEIHCRKDGLFETGKLVVLIDETSASASEVLAGALQDWDRATIIGRRSFGKGLVQQQYNLSNGGALRLTVSRYYTPLGRNIQKPYTAGKAKYMHEVVERYTDGEVVKGDTNTQKGKPFKTPKGNTVYGGGGITPDVFIGIDTSETKKLFYSLNKSESLEKFILKYCLNNKQKIVSLNNLNNLTTSLVLSEENWREFQQIAIKDSVKNFTLTDDLKQMITQNLKANIAKQVISNQAYYQVYNVTDTVINKALQILK